MSNFLFLSVGFLKPKADHIDHFSITDSLNPTLTLDRHFFLSYLLNRIVLSAENTIKNFEKIGQTLVKKNRGNFKFALSFSSDHPVAGRRPSSPE